MGESSNNEKACNCIEKWYLLDMKIDNKVEIRELKLEVERSYDTSLKEIERINIIEHFNLRRNDWHKKNINHSENRNLKYNGRNKQILI